jgi:hypothetical protein
MASIKISELRPAGSELFQDSESFLNELNEQEMMVSGGQVISDISITIGGNSQVRISDVNISNISAVVTFSGVQR